MRVDVYFSGVMPIDLDNVDINNGLTDEQYQIVLEKLQAFRYDTGVENIEPNFITDYETGVYLT